MCVCSNTNIQFLRNVLYIYFRARIKLLATLNHFPMYIHGVTQIRKLLVILEDVHKTALQYLRIIKIP